MNISHNAEQPPIDPLRRIIAGFYDWLLILALCMVGSIPVVAYIGEPVPTGNFLYQIALLVISVSYFCYCWTHGGQTPGMKTWYLKVESTDGGALSTKQCLQRFVGATVSVGLLGAGFWWAWTNPARTTWHDQWSNTRLKRTAKRTGKAT